MNSRQGITYRKMNDVVKLDVGGCLYTTSRSTLTRYPDSKLAVMFSGELDPSVRDANGAYVLDRDGPIFRYVLNFLRQGKLILPEDFKELDLLASEADYYQIGALVEAVKEEKYRRIIPEDETRKFEFIQINACVNVSYTCTGPPRTISAINTLQHFFNENRRYGDLKGISFGCDRKISLSVRPNSETNVHEDFERRKGAIFEDIVLYQLFRLKERSYTLNPAGVKEFKWTFARPAH